LPSICTAICIVLGCIHFYDPSVTAMHFPLATLELSRSARLTRTFYLRLLPAAIFAVTTANILFSISAPIIPQPEALNILAVQLKYLVQVLALGIVCIGAPVVTAGSVVNERKDGSLDLLLLAESRGWDIWLAKFTAAFLQMELLLASLGPLLAFVSWLGGITPREIVELLAITTSLNAFVCAGGILSSARCSNAVSALMLSMFLAMASSLVVYVLNESNSGFLTYVVPVIGATICAPFGVRSFRRQPKTRRGHVVTWRRRTRAPVSDSTYAIAAIYSASLSGHWGGLIGIPLVIFATPVVILLMLFTDYANLKALELVVLYDVISSIAWSRRVGSLESLALTGRPRANIAAAMALTHLRRSVPFVLILAAAGIFELSLPASLLWSPANISRWIFLLPADILSAAANIWFFVFVGCALSGAIHSPLVQFIAGAISGIAVQAFSSFHQSLASAYFPAPFLPFPVRAFGGVSPLFETIVLLIDTFVFGLASLVAYLIFVSTFVASGEQGRILRIAPPPQ
jgi:hypothetical protein